jgi:single-stranded-DNA-specific exonuclease
MANRQPLREGTVWNLPSYDPDWVQKIIDEFNIHPVTAQVLASRKFQDLEQIHDFLYAKLPDLHDPDLFQEMDKAVARVLQALQKGEKILIYGDNDVDGMTGTTLLTEFLEYLDAKVLCYISNRASLHQSLLLDAVNYASHNGCTLLITVDCGISGANEIEEAVRRHIDVIVTDHHEPTAPLPHCIATLNPKLTGSTYPNRDITGVGVAFKLAHAVTNQLIEDGKMGAGKVDLKRYLDLVALGTVADMASLTGENRILVRYGLKQLRKNKRVGLAKLCSLSEVKPSEITPLDIASKVAPPLNSLGRIADPNKGVKILLSRDATAAESLAKELEYHNLERQKIERKDSEDIDRLIGAHPEILNHKALVLHSPKWHPGIIPIITARIAKQYNRPTLVIAIDEGIGKGSLRTISEFPLLPTLKTLSPLLLNFGGHDFAAGLMIKAENIETFKEQFIALASQALQDQDLRSKLHLDAKIALDDLTFDFMESLSLLEPFGNGNPAPIFHCTVQQIWPPKVVGKSHLKLYVKDNSRSLEGIAFGMAGRRSELLRKDLTLDFAFTPHINTFLNKSSIQLHVKDFHVHE